MTQNRKNKCQIFGGNKIAAYDGKAGCNTVEYTMAHLYSD